MFAGERRDPSKGVEGLEAGFPEEEDKPSSKEGVASGDSYSSLNENMGRCCVAGNESEGVDITSCFGVFFPSVAKWMTRKKSWNAYTFLCFPYMPSRAGG